MDAGRIAQDDLQPTDRAVEKLMCGDDRMCSKWNQSFNWQLLIVSFRPIDRGIYVVSSNSESAHLLARRHPLPVNRCELKQEQLRDRMCKSDQALSIRVRLLR